MGGGTKRKTSTYLLGTEPEGATAADLDGVDDEINSIKAGFDSLNAQYQATASKYTQNVPTAYSATYPDRIWSEGGFLRVGPSKAFFVSVSGGLPTYQFNTPLFQPETYIFPSVDSDVASSYDSTTGHVTIPFDGLYLITGRMRSKDYTPAGTEWGVGVHTSNVDGPHFLWHAVNTTSTSFRRTTYPYIRVARFNAQDELRMFVYIAPQTPAKYFSAAGMQILRLSD